MTGIVVTEPRATSAAGRRAAWLAVAILGAFALVGAIWGAFAPRSLERQTPLGPLPLSPQDEVRVTGEVWLVLAAVVLGFVAMLLWWYVGPPRGPLALGWLVALEAAGGALALGAYVVVISMRGDAATRVDGQNYELLFAPGVLPVMLAPALVAVIAYSLAAVGSRSDELARRGEEPPQAGPAVGAATFAGEGPPPPWRAG